MGNIGGPSKGCHECRRLKVKCDEVKPECTRCDFSGKKCPGYRDNLSNRFRYATGGLDKRKYERRKQHERGSSPKSRMPPALATASTPAGQISKSKLLMKYVDSTSVLNLVSLLFEVFYTPQHGPSTSSLNSCFEFFTSTIKNSKHGSSVRLAISAVFRGFYSFISRNREMEALAKLDFTTAVSLAREALNDPEESKSDVTLLTVLFLSMFENIDCIKESRSPVITHQVGLVQLLQHRGLEALKSDISQFCLRQFYERFAAAVMGADQMIMIELMEAAMLLPAPDFNGTSSSFPVALIGPIADLRLKVEALDLYSNFDATLTQYLLSGASEIDKQLAQWPDRLEPSYHPTKTSPRQLLSKYGFDDPSSKNYYPDWADTYRSLAVAQDWNYYRYLRIVLNIFISRLAALLRQYSLAASADQVCEQMVDGVCASMLFYTGALQKNVESLKNNDQFIMPEVDINKDREYVSSAVGAMLIMPKLRWILKYYPSLRPRQIECLELQISNLSLFYRMHGVEEYTCTVPGKRR